MEDVAAAALSFLPAGILVKSVGQLLLQYNTEIPLAKRAS
jgi:hypothetical protein